MQTPELLAALSGEAGRLFAGAPLLGVIIVSAILLFWLLWKFLASFRNGELSQFYFFPSWMRYMYWHIHPFFSFRFSSCRRFCLNRGCSFCRFVAFVHRIFHKCELNNNESDIEPL